MSWTDERVALLKQLWGEGKTAAEIAKVLGDGITRNAVIGKAHRLKLSSRLSPIQQNTSKKTKSEPSVPRIVKPAVKIPEFKGKGIKLIDLDSRMCRWPVGDPREENFNFCGCDAVAGLPYCEEHCRVAYQVPTRTRTLSPDDFEIQAGTPTDFDIKHASNG